MAEFMTWEFFVGLVTLFATIESIRRHQGNKIEKLNTDLQEHKLHVAETYAAKTGVNAQFESVSSSINEIGKRMESRLDGMNERLDRVIEAGHKTPGSTRRSS